MDAPWTWKGWTVGMVRRGISLVAQHAKYPADKLLARMVTMNANMSMQSGGRSALWQRRRRRSAAVRRPRRTAPPAQALAGRGDAGKLSRYETHLSRQLFQALHELERLQAARAGADVPPPAVLDLNVNGPTPPLLALDGEGQS